jgi:hypothetical protein
MMMNFNEPARFLPKTAILLAAAMLLTLAGCGDISLEQDPAKTVKVEISGISDEADREQVSEALGGMTDGSSHSMTSFSSGDTMTVNLSPVTDVKAFSEKVNFGEVTEVKDRTVKVNYQE